MTSTVPTSTANEPAGHAAPASEPVAPGAAGEAAVGSPYRVRIDAGGTGAEKYRVSVERPGNQPAAPAAASADGPFKVRIVGGGSNDSDGYRVAIERSDPPSVDAVPASGDGFTVAIVPSGGSYRVAIGSPSPADASGASADPTADGEYGGPFRAVIRSPSAEGDGQFRIAIVSAPGTEAPADPVVRNMPHDEELVLSSDDEIDEEIVSPSSDSSSSTSSEAGAGAGVVAEAAIEAEALRAQVAALQAALAAAETSAREARAHADAEAARAAAAEAARAAAADAAAAAAEMVTKAAAEAREKEAAAAREKSRQEAARPPPKASPKIDVSGCAYQLTCHVKSRGPHVQYPARAAVPDGRTRWRVAWDGYAPKEFTHAGVFANDRELSTGDKWADPADVARLRSELEARLTWAAGGEIHPVGDAITFDPSTSRPLNPVGRTGMSGRGLLGKWGPNHAADPIVTRFDPEDERVLQMVAIKRRDTGQWAIPGGMVDPPECVSQTMRREFEEEAGNVSDELKPRFEQMCDTLFAHGTTIYRGYVDDPRNTDNAWIETVAMHFHCDAELGAMLPLRAGDDAAHVTWLDIDTNEPRYRDLYAGHREWVERVAATLRSEVPQPTGERKALPKSAAADGAPKSAKPQDAWVEKPPKAPAPEGVDVAPLGTFTDKSGKQHVVYPVTKVVTKGPAATNGASGTRKAAKPARRPAAKRAPRGAAAAEAAQAWTLDGDHTPADEKLADAEEAAPAPQDAAPERAVYQPSTARLDAARADAKSRPLSAGTMRPKTARGIVGARPASVSAAPREVPAAAPEPAHVEQVAEQHVLTADELAAYPDHHPLSPPHPDHHPSRLASRSYDGHRPRPTSAQPRMSESWSGGYGGGASAARALRPSSARLTRTFDGFVHQPTDDDGLAPLVRAVDPLADVFGKSTRAREAMDKSARARRARALDYDRKQASYGKLDDGIWVPGPAKGAHTPWVGPPREPLTPMYER